MYSPGWQGHTPATESTSNEVQAGIMGKGKAGSAYVHTARGEQVLGMDVKGDGSTQAPFTHPPPPTQAQSESDLLPFLAVVDQAGQLMHTPLLL